MLLYLLSFKKHIANGRTRNEVKVDRRFAPLDRTKISQKYSARIDSTSLSLNASQKYSRNERPPFHAAYGGFVLSAYRQRFDRTSKSKVQIVTVVPRRSVSLHARVRAFGIDSRVHFAPARLVTRTRPGMRPTGAQSSTGATSSFRSRHRPSATRTFPPRRSSNRSVTPRRAAPRYVASSLMRIALAPVSRRTGNSDIEGGRHRSSASHRPLRIRISRVLDLCRWNGLSIVLWSPKLWRSIVDFASYVDTLSSFATCYFSAFLLFHASICNRSIAFCPDRAGLRKDNGRV